MPRGMLSLLAGLGDGYNRQTQQEFDNTRRSKIDQIALDRAAREGVEFDQAQADRAELRAAGAPVVATPDMVQGTNGPVQAANPDPSTDSIDVGQPGTAPAIPAQRVGMQTMLSGDQANAATAKANSPDAMRARQLAVLQRQSPEKAAILQAHDLSLKNTQMDLANKEFDSAASAAASKGWDAFGEFMNNSQADNSKGKWVPSADGKTMQAYKQGPDGALTPSGLIFENTPKGLSEAATFVSKQVPITAKLKHYMDEKEATRKDTHESNLDTYRSGMLKIAQQNADTNEDYKGAMGDAAGTRAAGTGRKGDHFDEKQWDAVKKIEPSFVSFVDDMGGKPVESPELRLTYLGELNKGQSGGNMSPNEAAESARTTTLKLKNRASDMVAEARAADPKSTLTEAQAVRNILKAYGASEKKPAAPAAAARGAAPPVTPMQTAAAQAAPPVAPAAPAAPPAFAPQTGGDATLNNIEAQNVASMKPLNDAVTQASAQLAATAKSGDPVALQRYATALTQARAARDAAARQKFGNRADQYLASVGA